jgi:hypothetical protein
MTLNNFHYALSLLETLYGVNLPEEQFEEIALVGFNLIGNKRSRLYRYCTCAHSKEIELPCNAEFLESVTIPCEDWNYSTNDTLDGDPHSADIEQHIEERKHFTEPLHVSGKYVPYERVGNTLYFDKPYGKICILYKGLVLDDDGLPEITDKEAMALATYCAYVTKLKEGLQSNNTNTINLSSTLYNKWTLQCD